MKRFILWLPAVFGLFTLTACTRTDAPPVDTRVYAPGDSLEIVGTLIDTNCFSRSRENAGMDHPQPIPEGQRGPACARFCAMQGFPVGVLVGAPENGRVWILMTNGMVLADYMAGTVRARGTVRSNGILTPERVELKTEDGWTFIL